MAWQPGPGRGAHAGLCLECNRGERDSTVHVVPASSPKSLAYAPREFHALFISHRRNAEGRGAQTVYRDKATGKVMTADEALQAKVGSGR